MSNKKILAGVTAIVALIIVVTFSRRERQAPELRELTRAQLELRDEILFEKDTDQIFNGTLVENYAPARPKLTIEIREGKPHGISRGYYENGQQEVEEHFAAGISNGRRIRWHENGNKKSAAEIIDGKIEGTFTRWHANGKKAAEAQMLAGIPHGLSQAWHPSGKRKAAVELDHGQVVTKQYWKDGDA